MLGVTWRGAVALCAAAAVAVALAACGSMSNAAFGSNAGGGSDGGFGGGNDGGGFGDDGGLEADGGTDSGVTRQPSALFVNASASLKAVRLCWSTSGTGVQGVRPFPQQIMPASNYAGIAAGGASLMTNASALVGGALQLDVIPAKTVAQAESTGGKPLDCNDLICAGANTCLSPQMPTDYWTLPVPALTDGVTNVVALEGCLALADDPGANAARCGATWNATTGNLHAEVLPLVDSPAMAGTLYVQAAQLSPGLGSLLGAGGTAALSLGTASAPAASGGIASLGAEGQLAPPYARTLTLPTQLSDFGSVGIRIDVAGVDAGAGDLFMSLSQAQQLVDPSVDPGTYYEGGGTYLVAVLGDPDAPHAFSSGASGPYDGTGLHVLVLRAQPAP